MSPYSSILIIDDDDIFRRRLAQAFADRELAVSQASNSAAALNLARIERPHRIVLDLRLKNESGLELLTRLRALDPLVEILVLTGYGTIATAVEALKAGAVNYLTKPVNADGVLQGFNANSKSPSAVETPHLDQVEWEHIQRVVNEYGGNISRASKALGMHRRSLQRKLAKNPAKLR